jgi:adenylate cyclase
MLRVFITYKKSQNQIEIERGPMVFGRGPTGRGAWQAHPRRRLDDQSVSWDHLYLEELPGSRVRLQNLSNKFAIKLASGVSILPGASSESVLPVRLTLGETLLQIESPVPVDAELSGMQTLDRPVRPNELKSITGLTGQGEGIETEMLTRWFEAVIAIQHASISTGDFYDQTARAVVELIGLDRGLVLMRRDDDWEVIARHEPEPILGAPSSGTDYSLNVLRRVVEERRTFYQNLANSPITESLSGIDSVVAAPVLAEDSEQIVGAVYGIRLKGSTRFSAGIRPLEAQLVQVLAAAVGAGLARSKAEENAARRRVQFEQFFSAELARELDRDKSLLEGREREVTVLFSDIRGFSRVSEKLTPSEVCQLACDVMDRLTERVREFGGTVVSYSGDGMMALWNAPADQPDHAILACKAALAMHAELPGLDAIWQSRIERPLALGIGLNTGKALVGNTGSRTKFMYGPQGHTVNLASRVEGATKQLGVPILITGTTHQQLNGTFATRRLCRVRVVGIEGAVELYQLYGVTADATWTARRDAYELGLSHYEAGRWADACTTLYPLLAGGRGVYDLPSLSLVGRCIDCLKAPSRPFDPIFEFDHK